MTWGLGAVVVTSVPKGTVLECCGRKTRKEEGLHHYLYGPPRCTACATAYHDGIDHQPDLFHEEDRCTSPDGSPLSP